MIEEQKMDVPLAQPPGSESASQLREIVEALLFASDEPVTLETLHIVFDDMNRDAAEGEKLNPSNEDLRAAVDSLNAEYDQARRAYRIQQIAGGYSFVTDKKFALWVGRLFKEKARRKLSQTAVETLAIIAYKQPITKSEVEFIRGVNADYIMKTLLEKNLATIVGRAHSPGRPLLYGTTPEFLKHFGLNEISDLPKPREIEELLGETELEVEKRMLASQQEIEFKEKLQEKLDPNSRAPHIPRKKSKLQEPPAEDIGSTVIEKATPLPPRTPAATIPGDKVSEPETIEIVPAEDALSSPPPVEEPPVSLTAPTEISDVPGEPSVVDAAPMLPAEIEERIETPERSSPPGDELEISRGEVTPEVSALAEPAAAEVVDDLVSGGEEQAETAIADEERSKKGWSKWKTKIQTLFRKLFG